MKSQEITKVIKIYHLHTMDIYTEFMATYPIFVELFDSGPK